MIIYHGSSEIIKNPLFMGGDDYNDYGNGFYTTNEADLAREWSVRPNEDGYLNIYELNTKGLKFVDLNKSCYTALNWMALLYKNRQITGLERHKQRIEKFIENFLPDISEADVVIGYRADDRYFRFGKLFIRNDLPLKDLEDALLLGNLGQQIFLRSEKSFQPDRLKFLGYERVGSIDWYAAKERRENNANKAFEKIENRPRTKDAITIEDVLDGDGWKYARPADTLCKNKIVIPEDAMVIKANYCFESQMSIEVQSESKNSDQVIARSKFLVRNGQKLGEIREKDEVKVTVQSYCERIKEHIQHHAKGTYFLCEEKGIVFEDFSPKSMTAHDFETQCQEQGISLRVIHASSETRDLAHLDSDVKEALQNHRQAVSQKKEVQDQEEKRIEKRWVHR
ncbi:MAG: DUF3990 domain-containing protein [Lachnospiraceae bacterium]|nr:DUF3990 domain-containing protein [Lachnospiraceae bacterium]